MDSHERWWKKSWIVVGIALIYLLFWGLFGVSMGVSFVFTLSYEWTKVTGADFGDVPPGIMLSGSLGGAVAILLCAFSGLLLYFFRRKKWELKSLVLSGILGPCMGIAGALIGLFSSKPVLIFILLVGGMSSGAHIG